MENLTTIGIWAGSGFAFLLVIGFTITRLYRRATKEIGFVRTGFGGEKVVMNGGALVLPVLHETMPVNMNTVRLAVDRNNVDALITLAKKYQSIPMMARTHGQPASPTTMGKEMANFKSNDDVVHGAAVAMAKNANQQDLKAIAENFQTMIGGCISCHSEFKTKVAAILK